ncbi:MAG: peptide-methionine (S)-S-oxide reductase MsrA [Planctomycetes bacterium]|nr:peptide-methionine (S)-S-oxide reductase MsrA [Planctomycetota bacterium]
MPFSRLIPSLASAVLLLGLAGCSNPADGGAREVVSAEPQSQTAASAATSAPEESPAVTDETRPAGTEIATFGAGCFWCVEAVLEQIDGVLDVRSGYMGGTVANPSYKQVCTGTTGHAEVAQITFDPTKISYSQLLGWFWKLHDPTTLNQQGADHGTQYRSVIFWHTEAQRDAALASKKKVEDAGVFDRPIVTEITRAGPFYEAEDYHQDYYRQNKGQAYCQYVISPKLEKLGLEQ